MTHVVFTYRIRRDHTGVEDLMPVILTEFGPLVPLLRYMLKSNIGRSSQAKLILAVGLLLDFMEANHDAFENPSDLFETFVQRLYTGTVGPDGDPSGLYWDARKPDNVRGLMCPLSAFSDWLSKDMGTVPLNPWREATHAEQRIAWAAWQHKKNRAFLGHTMSRHNAELEVSRARQIQLKRSEVVDHERAKIFPADRIEDLLFRGFARPGKQKSPRVHERLNLRDVLITMLMYYGGLRMSEPFHLWVHDVQEDPQRSGHAWVRVYHPRLGDAPKDWMERPGKSNCDRGSYLIGKYGLVPRNELPNTHRLYAGWKGNALRPDGHYIDVEWFPGWAGELFYNLWRVYLIERAEHGMQAHPYAFVTKRGEPYSIDAFEDAHAKALRRIGLVSAKMLGTSPHGHRHAYGQALSDAKVNPLFIQAALHHKSPQSQRVYTEPDRRRLQRALEQASNHEVPGSPRMPKRPDLLAYGFEDVDPLSLFSGPNPRLARHQKR